MEDKNSSSILKTPLFKGISEEIWKMEEKLHKKIILHQFWNSLPPKLTLNHFFFGNILSYSHEIENTIHLLSALAQYGRPRSDD